MNSIAWLKSMNARGSEIYIRPKGPHGLVLVNRLKAQTLSAMRHQGLEPTVVVESSPGMFEAWVALSARPVADHLRCLVAEALEQSLGRPATSATANGFGHLAGFTVDDRTRLDTRRRFALAHEGQPGTASAGPALIERIESASRAAALERGRRPAIKVHGALSGDVAPPSMTRAGRARTR